MVIGHSMQMRRVKVKEADVLLPFAVLMTANIAVLLAWTIVDPLKWVRTEPDDQNQSHGFCQADDRGAYKFLIPIGVINALALILANVQAFRARNVSTEYSESSYIFFAMLSLLQALIIGVPLLIIVNDNEVANYFVWCGIIFVIATAILGFIFGPKIFQVRTFARDNSATGGTPSGYSSQPTPSGTYLSRLSAATESVANNGRVSSNVDEQLGLASANEEQEVSGGSKVES